MKNAKKKILIVEDEPIIRVLKLKFENAGFSVDIAGDGKEALEKLRAKKPDIILLDLLLPKMDGFEFLEKAKADERFKDIPVIIFSNLEKPQNSKIERVREAEEYIVKTNVTPDELIEKAKKYT